MTQSKELLYLCLDRKSHSSRCYINSVSNQGKRYKNKEQDDYHKTIPNPMDLGKEQKRKNKDLTRVKKARE